jgi:DNA-binding CsgD family transcriptional regulator
MIRSRPLLSSPQRATLLFGSMRGPTSRASTCLRVVFAQMDMDLPCERCKCFASLQLVRANREIASALVISDRTVARHVQNIFAKLGVSSRAAASVFAVEQELL